MNPSEKYEFVSWDDDIPNIWKKTCSKPPKTWSHLPKPSSNQQFTSSLPRSGTGPPTAFAIQSGLQIRLWTAGMTTPSFSNVLSSAQPLRSYSASPQSQDPRIWTQLDSAGFSFTSCPMVPRTKGRMSRMSRTSPSKKRVIFLEIIWDDDGSPNGIRSEKYRFFFGPPEKPRGALQALPWKALGQHNSLDRWDTQRSPGNWLPIVVVEEADLSHPVTCLPWPNELPSSQHRRTTWKTCRLTPPN